MYAIVGMIVVAVMVRAKAERSRRGKVCVASRQFEREDDGIEAMVPCLEVWDVWAIVREKMAQGLAESRGEVMARATSNGVVRRNEADTND
jgi:hypothetical protein